MSPEYRENYPSTHAITPETRLPVPPYDEVAAAFEDFKPPRNAEGRFERGGVIVEDTKPRIEADEWRSAPKRVEASFTAQQNHYVRTCIAKLNTLVVGNYVVVPGETAPTPLAYRIQDNFLAQQPGEASFNQAYFDGLVATFENFGHMYPSLMPAMSAMSSVAGIEGVCQAYRTVAMGEPLAQALGMSSEEPRISPYLLGPKGVSGYHFIARHPSMSSEPEYEVRCSGSALAKNIIRQAHTAARLTAETPGVGSTYNPAHDEPFMKEPDLKGALVDVVESAAEAAARANQHRDQ